MADTAPAEQDRLASGDVPAALQRVLALLFPSNLAGKAALLAVVVALLPLLPSSQAPRIWELPHLLLLGIIISYGVFGQKNADAEVAAAAKPVDDESVEAYVSQMMQASSLVFECNDDDGEGDDGGGTTDSVHQAWSSQYLADDPLVVVADAAGDNDQGGASEKPLLLPMRKLKPAAQEESAAVLTAGDDVSDVIEEEEEEEELLAPKAAYDGVREHAIASPSSVLDADMALSPSSSPPLLPPPPPPPPAPFLGAGRSLRKAKARSFNEFGMGSRGVSLLGLHTVDHKQLRSRSAVHETRSTMAGYDPPVSIDDDEADDGEMDETAAASDRSSFSSDAITGIDDDDDKEGDHGYVDDGSSCDEELFELAAKPGPEADAEEVGAEVDKKAEEFIAKFKEQIRMQRVEPARR